MSKRTSTPTVAQLEEELHRVSYLTRFHVMLQKHNFRTRHCCSGGGVGCNADFARVAHLRNFDDAHAWLTETLSSP